MTPVVITPRALRWALAVVGIAVLCTIEPLVLLFLLIPAVVPISFVLVEVFPRKRQPEPWL